MRSAFDSTYIYQPWSEERRAAASARAKARIEAKRNGIIFPPTPRLRSDGLVTTPEGERRDINKIDLWHPDRPVVREWSQVFTRRHAVPPRPKPIRKRPVTRATMLAYPFIVKPREEYADIIKINTLVPKSLPGRADVCQAIMLAILEGETSLEALHARGAGFFIKRFYSQNHEQAGHAIPLDTTRDDWGGDTMLSSLAAKEWARERYADEMNCATAWRAFTPATQLHEAWQDQIRRRQLHHHAQGEFYSADEVEELLSDDPSSSIW